jgi:CRP/FNR family transcriptional regulator, anaerobic regulatory protein
MIEKLQLFFQKFIALSTEELQIIGQLAQPKKLKKGEFLAEAGKICRNMAFIEKGMMRNFYLVEGNEITRYVSLENNFLTAFGSFIRQEPSQEYVQALEPCQLHLLSYDNLQNLYQTLPKMNNLVRLVMENEYYCMEKRVFEMIALTAEQRYEILLKERPDLIQRVPLQYLASMLGISPETLSRIRKKITFVNS